MPTADGRFRGISVPSAAWERIFCKHERWAVRSHRCLDCGIAGEELYRRNRDNRPLDR